MNRRRFYAPPSAFNFRNQTVALAEDEARHLREVLRLKPGSEVTVFDGKGREFQGVVEQSRRESASLKINNEIEPAKPESPLQLTLAIALLKGEKFDLAVQKATELGVTEIVPVTSQFADIRLRDDSDTTKRVARWQRIALEAAKQSGRAVVPEVSSPTTFANLIQEASGDTSRLMFSERDGESLPEVIGGVVPQEVWALVGPEGGWASEEIAMARESGWKIVTLGGRILRAETAAIAITALLQHLYGDLR